MESPGATRMTTEQALTLADAELQAGHAAQAEAIFRQIIASQPDCAAAWGNLGNLLEAQGQWSDAAGAHGNALRILPNIGELHFKLANALQECNRIDQAIIYFRSAVALSPGDSDLMNRLGHALYLSGDVDQAVAILRQAIAVDPISAPPYNNLGNILRELGRLDEALAAFDRAIQLAPVPAFCSNRIYLLHFHPDAGAAAILREQRRFNDLFVKPLAKIHVAITSDRSKIEVDLNRRLRIGYVSPDLREHVVGLNILPLVQNHDRQNFEIFCYANVSRADATTEKFRVAADHWRDIAGAADEQAVQSIVNDKIDILVDLSLHMGANRLMVFARKPAPVQVTFGGYPGGTGLETMDYRLSDPYLDPPEFDGHYVEKTIRLPDSFWCYDPVAMGVADDLPVNELPALRNGYITFGCLNNFAKVNDATLRLWTVVMGAVRESRLLLQSPQGETRRSLIAKFSECGINARRLTFVGYQKRAAYFKLYHQIDIGLDTLPYNGHSTSLDSLWMGAPVVTLAGNTVVGRAGWSQLNNLKLTELSAKTPNEFVQIAVKLASDPSILAAMRAGMRQRMLQSPLTDGKKFARNIESAYRQMWRKSGSDRESSR
jgi:predicted O-linked N-acetylglucosamine transferase (SPINDLY family)